MKKIIVSGIGLVFLMSCSVNKTLTMGDYQGKHYDYGDMKLSLMTDSSFTINSRKINYTGKWLRKNNSVFFYFNKPTDLSTTVSLLTRHTIPIDQAYSVKIINKNKLLDADHTILKKVK